MVYLWQKYHFQQKLKMYKETCRGIQLRLKKHMNPTAQINSNISTIKLSVRDEMQPLTEDQPATDANITEQSPAAPKSITSIAAVIAPALALAACGGGGEGGSPSAGPAAPPPAGPAAPPPPPLVPPTGVQAGRFLAQSTMGATKTEIAAVQAGGYDSWISAQFAMPREMRLYDWMVSKGDAVSEFGVENKLNPGVWRLVISGNDQLRQRVGVALLDFLVVSANGLTQTRFPHLAAAAYFDLLWDNAFGNYRDLIGKISTSTTMAVYLTFLNSKKADPKTGSQPDENYARELMQLFTLGLVKLNPDGTVQTANGKPIETYTADDVSGLARVLTGFRYDPSYAAKTPDAHLLPLVQDATAHEPGAKTFLGTTIPAGTDGFASLKIALDTIFAHPNLPPFVSKQLIQRLVTSNPSAAYVGRVSAVFANNGSGVRGDLKAVIRAILLDTEARSDAGLTNPSFGKLRAPVVRLTNWARAFGVTSEGDKWLFGDTSSASTGLGQMIGRAPSVFNFFRPGYKPPNTSIASSGLVAPEFQITNEPSVIAYVNFMQGMVERGANDAKPNYTDILKKAPDSQALVDELNFLLAAGQLSAATVAAIKTAVDSISLTAFESSLNRVRLAILLVMATPEYITQK